MRTASLVTAACRWMLTILTVAASGVIGCEHRGPIRVEHTGTGCVVTGAPMPEYLRVLSYNIHHGEGLDGDIDMPRLAEVINAARPDLVALQEVDKGVERTSQRDQPAILAELTGMHAVFEKNIDFQGGEYGNAVLSRYPVVRYVNHKLPKTIPDEQRGMLEVHVDVDGRPVVFLATHFDYHGDDTERRLSADMTRKLVEALPHRTVILAGDLNTRPGSAVMEKMEAFLMDAHDAAAEGDPGYTFPADAPDRRIDFVMYHPDGGLVATTSRVIDGPLVSDHRPLLTVFRWVDEE